MSYDSGSSTDHTEIVESNDPHASAGRSTSSVESGGLNAADRIERLWVSPRMVRSGKEGDNLYTLDDLSVEAVAMSGRVLWADILHTLSLCALIDLMSCIVGGEVWGMCLIIHLMDDDR